MFSFFTISDIIMITEQEAQAILDTSIHNTLCEMSLMDVYIQQNYNEFAERITREFTSMATNFYDYTLNNSLIKDYFEGKEYYTPVAELMYLHTHPLVIPNFMTELSEMITKAGKAIENHKLGVYYTDKLTQVAIKIGQQLPEFNSNNAIVILAAMREAYQLCKDLSKMA